MKTKTYVLSYLEDHKGSLIQHKETFITRLAARINLLLTLRSPGRVAARLTERSTLADGTTTVRTLFC